MPWWTAWRPLEAWPVILQELLRCRHLVRHLYPYELQPEPVERLRTLALALALWPEVRGELKVFQGWLTGPWD